MARKKVVFVYRYIPQYRLPFYKCLHDLCKDSEIDLTVLYGDPSPAETKKGDSVDFKFGKRIANWWFSIGSRELVWQPVLPDIQSADLVVVEQANKLLINYLLILRQAFGGQKFAYWGHGKNYQAGEGHRASEWLKRRMINSAYWWFAYTPGVARLIEATGYPQERITVLYNSIDTADLRAIRERTSQDDLAAARADLGIQSNNICIYVGGMYTEKRLPFLLDACVQIRQRVSDFRMIFIGAGQDDLLVRRFCADNPWAVYLGAKFGSEKVKYLLMSKLMLMPGLIGLAVVDAFTLGVPIITTNVTFHSPEIEYIVSGDNGVIVSPEDNSSRYAASVVELLTDETKRQILVEGCKRSETVYSIENMAARFFRGLSDALSLEQ
jgi:glycosyltransferase involved in cell wall biosynthesis